VDVNAVLEVFLARIRAILEDHFVGMYVVGSLALGDFDPRTSDIDFLVVTDTELGDDLFRRLYDMHAQLAAGDSPWMARVEAVYIPREALRRSNPASRYPQIEKGAELFRDALESGWVFQRYTLRECSVVVAGPDPRTLLDPVDPQEMPPAVAAIAGLWLEQARHDPSWLAWLRDRHNQAFVILTLCRMLYSLATGMVASKPAAARWAQMELGAPWAALIVRSLARQHEPGELSQPDVDDTVAMIQYTVTRSHPGPCVRLG
jgi:predicted nucleotidyltransferase